MIDSSFRAGVIVELIRYAVWRCKTVVLAVSLEFLYGVVARGSIIVLEGLDVLGIKEVVCYGTLAVITGYGGTLEFDNNVIWLNR